VLTTVECGARLIALLEVLKVTALFNVLPWVGGVGGYLA